MADYWVKLYIEILDDPKMATLPDRVWRRIIELFLVAKRINKDGHMPDTRQLAWMLRLEPDELDSDMAQISATGIIQREVNGWHIPKFAARQDAVPGSERKRQQRARAQSQQYNGNVTNVSRNSHASGTIGDAEAEAETETETEAERARDADAFTRIRSAVETITGYPATPRDVEPITRMIARGIEEQDIKAALTFLVSVNKTPRGAADLENSAYTAQGKRTQGKRARPQPAFVPSEEFGL